MTKTLESIIADNVRSLPVSGLSFPIRRAGKDLSWILYKATDTTTNRLVSLIIKNIPLGGNAMPQRP